MDFDLAGKLPGKTKFSGRRRTSTRRAGFTSHPDSTGGEYQDIDIESYHLEAGESITVSMSIPEHKIGELIAFGGWYYASESVEVSIENSPFKKVTLVRPCAPNWSKFGSMGPSLDGKPFDVVINFQANSKARIAFYKLGCGVVHHRHLDDARDALLKNMYQFSPEAHFFERDDQAGEVVVYSPREEDGAVKLHLKSCNRCARFLPVNFDNELVHLSFSNHCKADHRRPCSHTGFGKLLNVDTNQRRQLEYGYQLECRFCKKFEVNAAHNPQRTAAQMKEDGARRRALELLLTELYQGSPQLLYRQQTNGSELADDIWEKFGRKCFNCGEKLVTQKKMHLDHTRPLALLWPLDATATCLCGSCNSEKRDRPPSIFYTNLDKLKELSKITKIPLDELQNPTPNLHAINLLQGRLNWFFDVFCQQPVLMKERDGKVAAELLIKAIQKTLNKCPGGAPFDIAHEYERRRKK